MFGKSNSLIFGVGAAFIGVAIIRSVYKKKCCGKINWKYVGNLSELYIYPIKSCAGISIQEADCQMLGLKKTGFFDRNLMVVDVQGNFLSGRTFPSLVQIKPSFQHENILNIEVTGMPNLKIDLNNLDRSQLLTSYIWGDKVSTIDCGNQAAEWFSKFILGSNYGLRLVFYPATKSNRVIREKFTSSKNMKKTDCGTLGDGTSYMLINQTSVNNLNKRLDQSVASIQFRPNFIVDSLKPYNEDNWKLLKIGDCTLFEAVLPCVRCQFINVDPETGKRNENSEPLQTLKSYRQCTDVELKKIVGDSPKMGIHLGLRKPGTIKIGDPVFVSY